MNQLVFNAARVWNYVSRQTPVPLVSGMQGIGLERGGQLVAGALYEGYTGHNIWVHLAGDPGGRWMNRQFLRAGFAYPFLQLGCRRLSGWVEASNAQARRFDEHIGFKLEAVLKGAGRDGDDVMVYVMWRDECRFLEVNHGR